MQLLLVDGSDNIYLQILNYDKDSDHIINIFSVSHSVRFSHYLKKMLPQRPVICFLRYSNTESKNKIVLPVYQSIIFYQESSAFLLLHSMQRHIVNTVKWDRSSKSCSAGIHYYSYTVSFKTTFYYYYISIPL